MFTMLLLGILLNVNFTSCSKDDIVPDTEQGDNNDGSEDDNDDADNDEDKIVYPNGIPRNIPNNIIYYITNLYHLHLAGCEYARLGQSENTQFSISVTDGGIETLARLEQPLKASYPICVTDGGIETLVRLEQSSKAPSFISVSHSGMMTLPFWML